MARTNKKQERAAERVRVATVVVNYFNTTYGTDATRLGGWQDLCRDVGVEAAETIEDCKSHLKGIFLNIVDFVNAKQHGGEFERFGSRKKLRTYINGDPDTRRFPLKKAKKNLFLKWMLITLWEEKPARSKKKGTAKQRADGEEAGGQHADIPGTR